jgi:diguanylate cyclase (GGDEF)-like protein
VLRAKALEIDRFTQHEWLVLATIVSELAVAVDKAQLYRLTTELANTDELTGLYNYRHLSQVLGDEVDRARRYDHPLSLLMIDFDRFKLVNDTYGHIVGDQVLVETAQVLRDSLRSTDLLARYGGEEFSAVLPETEAEGALAVAEKLRMAVAEHEFLVDGRPIGPLSVSTGFASYPEHANSAQQLLSRADDALYSAKAAGRNAVRGPPEGATPRERGW